MTEAPVNADPAELAKFSELAHRWWDPESEFRPLHQINPLRLEWIQSHLPLAGKRVLDVGCGGGILADSMARRGAQVLGIDLASKALKVAQLHALEAQTANVEYREISAEAIAAEQPASFDAVTCMEMLEHVPDPRQTLGDVRALLRPGGALVVEVPNIDCWPVKMLRQRHRHFARHHFTFFAPATLTRLLAECGFDVQSISFPARAISVRLFNWGLQSWHPLAHRFVGPVLGSRPLRDRVLRLNFGEVLSICARRRELPAG